MEYNEDNLTIVANSKTVSIILAGGDKRPYFKANDAAILLGYSNYKKAVTQHVSAKRIKTLDEILKTETPVLGTPPVLGHNDLTSRYVSESGLYQLVMKSKLEFAERFQDWVVDDVLPSIRRHGNYDTQPSVRNDITNWEQARVDGIMAHKIKNRTLKDLIEGCFDSGLYPIVNNMINQAVLDFTVTTRQFKYWNNIPQHMSIPDFLDPYGQVARLYVESATHKFFTDNKIRLKTLDKASLREEIDGIAEKLRAGCRGYGDLQALLLDKQQATTKKRELTHKRKHLQITASTTVQALQTTAL